MTITSDLIVHNFNLEVSGFFSALQGAPPRHIVGQSFLHELAREGDVLSAEVLINAGSKIDLPDDEGRRPLHEAAFFGRLEMVQFLVSNGALIDAPIHPFGYTALYYAVQQGHMDVVRFLLECGARLNVEDRLTGQGLLHIAAMRGDMQMTGVLIAAGIDVFFEDKKGQTARDHAARANNRSLEGVLLKVMEHHAKH
jgi:ankyrin repeat protein